MIAPSLAAVAIHALLNHDPVPVIRDDETVQIEIKTVLHRCAVHLRDQSARRGKRRAVKPDPIADCDKLMRRLA